MWDVDNQTPYSADSIWDRSKEGVPEWIVAVKGTFEVRADGEAVVAEEQLEPLVAAEYNGDGGVSSLRYDADLVGAKPTTDIVVNGTAYSPGGRPSVDFPIELRVGPLRKVLRVKGDRWWQGDGERSSAPEPVSQVPIVYELAYGGYDHVDPDPKNHALDARNPVGCGRVADSRRRVGTKLPNFEYPDGKIEEAGPAGFGAIDAFWSPRREYLGTYDGDWERDRKPLLPEDWDPRSRLCSPPDQQPPSHLHGGEVVELINLTPGGHWTFRLPRVHLRFTTQIRNRTEEHRGQLSTVVIEPDKKRVLLVWLSTLPCPTDVDYLEETKVRMKRILR
jgi:hypothetical protein